MGDEGPGQSADHVRPELSLLLSYGESLTVVFREGATTQIDVCTGRGLNLPSGDQMY